MSTVDKWKVDLLNAGSGGFETLGKAIDRLTHDMARILGAESLLLGGQGGGSGSKALSEDKSRNLYLSVNATNTDIGEGARRDLFGPIWMFNGLDPDLMPRLDTADVAFKDVAVVAKALADMATAGAILAPDDPAIDDMRDLLGVSRQPEGQAQQAAEVALLPRITPPKGGAIQPGGANPEIDGGSPGGDQGAVEGGKPGGSGGAVHGGGKKPPEPGPAPARTAGGRNRTSRSSPT